MEWTELVSQSIPALAAVLGGAVTGVIQFVNRKSERNYEEELKKEGLNQARSEAAQERKYIHVEQQKEAVRQFLLTLRDQQNKLIQARTYIREQKEEKELKGHDIALLEWEVARETLPTCRQTVIQAWDQLELVATDKHLKDASNAVGKALLEPEAYSDSHIFPGLGNAGQEPPVPFEELVSDLRNATSTLYSRLK